MTSRDDGPTTRTLLPEDAQQGLAVKRPRPLRSLMIVFGVVVLLIAAIAIANHSGGSGGSDDADGSGGGDSKADPTAASGVPPVQASAGGIPKGFEHTEQGAQSAAANYAVALGSAAMFKPDKRHAIVDAVYAPQAATALKAKQDRAYTEDALARVGLNAQGDAPDGMTFISRTVPVGTKADTYGTDSATVSVWCTGLIGLAGEGSKSPVRTDWLTYTFQMQWTNGDWKITKDTQKQGPAPVNGDVPVSGADEIAGAVDQYGGFTYAR